MIDLQEPDDIPEFIEEPDADFSDENLDLPDDLVPLFTEDIVEAEIDDDLEEDELDVELSVEDDTPRIQQLIELGKQKGAVTYEHILEFFPDAEQDVSRLDEANLALLEAGIEIVDELSDDLGEDFEDDSEENDAVRLLRRVKRKTQATDDVMLGVDVDDTIGLYLKEIGKVPLLTADEEVWLAKRMERMVSAQDEIRSTGNKISLQRKSELRADIEDGLSAREHLVTANSRLVISVAKKYIGRGVPFLDLIQEGNIGLLRAAKKFDYHRGHKFSTYATWWIRQAVTRAIADQGRTIRVPVHMGDQINKLLRISHTLTQRLGRDPKVEEIAGELGVSSKKVEDMIQIARRPLSLEMPTDDEEDSTLGDFIEDEDSPAPAEQATKNLLREHLQEVLADLPPREVRILQLRYGLLDGESYTLEEVGKKMGVTRERVRQIEAQALSRLRHPSHRRKLRDYLKGQ